MSIATILYANLVPLCGLVLLTVLIKINPLFDQRQNKLFMKTAWITIGMLVAISLDYILSAQTFEYAWMFRSFTSFLNFAVSPLILICIIRIISIGKLNPVVYIPFFINLGLCFASLFARVVFTVEPVNRYARGPLFFFPFSISVFYLGVLIWQSVKNRGQNLYEALFLMFVILFLCSGMYLEIVHRYHFLAWDFTALSLVMYYLLLNINQSMFDHLTKTYNRAMYNKRIQALNKTAPCVIAVIDLNGFKKINDQYGHETGDLCLIQFVNVLKQNILKKDMLYRVGGDEFALISPGTKAEMEQKLERGLAALEEHRISFSYGIKEYRPSEEIEAVINEADQLMYRHKNAR